MRKPLLGIGKAACRGDRCSACRLWDALISELVVHKFTEGYETMELNLNTYWKDFSWNGEDGDKAAKPSTADGGACLKAWLQYVETHRERRGIDEDGEPDIQKAEDVLRMELTPVLQKAEVSIAHWTRDT